MRVEHDQVGISANLDSAFSFHLWHGALQALLQAVLPICQSLVTSLFNPTQAIGLDAYLDASQFLA